MRDNGVDKSPNTRKQLRNCISPLLPRKKSIIYPKKLGFFRLTRLSQNSIGTLKIRKGRKRTWPQNLGFLVCSSVRLKRYQSQFHSFFFLPCKCRSISKRGDLDDELRSMILYVIYTSPDTDLQVHFNR